jgi:superfamily II DNA or RNA helicase
LCPKGEPLTVSETGTNQTEANLPLAEGQVVSGTLFSEPMRVETIRENGYRTWVVGLCGLNTERFRRVTLTEADLHQLHIQKPQYTYDGDGQTLRIGIQAYSLGIAYEFDPYFGLSISRVDPLPHQLEAVYDYLLKLARVRFLLADDAGAGKTIMAGLLIRELKLRGLAERILVICPANLAFQWQRELKEKFEEKFVVLKGDQIREQFGINQWLETPQVITSLDLAKRENILPGLKQVRWDLVIVDEAHRMSWSPPSRKTARYALGELLRDSSDHLLLLTATPHKGDPANFSLFLQLLDEDAFADVKSIREAMERRRAPFYLRRTKEAMVYFPQRKPDGTWEAKKIFTKRIPTTVDFHIDGREDELYREVTAFVKSQSHRAAANGDDPRARAIRFLMALYQRRLASSTYSLRRSLENRAKRLGEMLKKAQEVARFAPPELPDMEELEEMEDSERERLEDLIAAVSLARNPEQVKEEVAELKELVKHAMGVEDANCEAKLSKLQELLSQQGFFNKPQQQLLIFTEFKDTLDYIVKKLKEWGFTVGTIHGGMQIGSRDETGTRLNAEQQFREGTIQVLVATEAAGEGINLQCCHILFNYDIPWNPNRLEQRMGRIHRYGQTKDCLIFNFVATNTIEGHVLQRLLEKLQEIRDALENDSVFNVVGEILPPNEVERILRDYYAGKIGNADLEERLLRDVKEEHFRSICQNALEGLATKKLNLEMLIERRALAQERRLVPETIARFVKDAATLVPLTLKTFATLPYTFEPTATPPALRRFDKQPDWKGQPVAARYPRFSTDREVADHNNLEWVTPGHPLFEALRRHAVTCSQEALGEGACFYSLEASSPARVDFYRARIVDGRGHIVHERLFAVEIDGDGGTRLSGPAILGNLQPAIEAETPSRLAAIEEPTAWLHEAALMPFLEEVRKERVAEVERIAAHIEMSLTELISKEDAAIGRWEYEAEQGVEGAAGNLKQAEDRHSLLLERRDNRRREMERQQSLTLQAVDRLTSIIILPHPERDRPDIANLRPDPETEAVAMRLAMAYEENNGRTVQDVHEKNLGYDLTSIDSNSGELRLIEVKGIGASTGTVCLTPNEKRVAEDRPDCFWLYVASSCKGESPVLNEPIPNPAKMPWIEVKKIEHYYLTLSAINVASTDPKLYPDCGKKN